MDCSICSALPYMLRPPRINMCTACYEGARAMISLTNKHDNNNDKLPPFEKLQSAPPGGLTSPLVSTNHKGFASTLKWLKEMKDMEEQMMEKISYLSAFVAAFRDQIHADIQVKPGSGGDTAAIPAHKALLAARSEIFKNILDSDECKAPPCQTITLPELNHEELESLLEFLYSGNLSKEKAEKHVFSLAIAADKYEIPFLQKFCENQMMRSLSSSNALDVLEISDTCSNQSLKETALNFIVKNMEDVVFSARFEAFALKNPHLTVQITRASFMDIRGKKGNAT